MSHRGLPGYQLPAAGGLVNGQFDVRVVNPAMASLQQIRQRGDGFLLFITDQLPSQNPHIRGCFNPDLNGGPAGLDHFDENVLSDLNHFCPLTCKYQHDRASF